MVPTKSYDYKSAKTKELLISLRKEKLNPPPATIDGIQLERVRSVRILGIELSDDLRWGSHLETQINNAKSTLFLLRRLKFITTKRDFEYLVNALMIPKLLYAFPAWCNIPDSYKEKLQVVLNIACRIGDINQIDIRKLMNDAVLRLYNASENRSHPLHFTQQQPVPHGYSLRRIQSEVPRTRTEKFRRHFVSSAYRLLH